MKLHRSLGWMATLALALAALLPAPGALAAAAPPITVPFDHLTTGFELDGVHRDLPCEACHLNAVFKGTPRDCGTCHITGSPFNATPKTATHIPSTNNCAACHNTISFRPDVHFDHAEVMGSCASCHNGTIAQGEGPTHPSTSQDCASCHTVMSWNPAKAVDHTQIPLAVAGFCIVCHNGVQAAGKSVGHIATTLECGDCHLTTTWLAATFDHTGITSGCASCHNGVKAVGKQGNHMPTTVTCEICHTTGLGTKAPSWAPAVFDHTQMTVTTCQTCHSGTVKITTGFVSGQPANHVPPIPSTVDCGLCHGNNPAAETWALIAVSIPTLHSGLPVSNCLLCHAGQTFAGVPAPYTPMSTSGVSPTKATPLAPPHIPVLVGSDCSSCHSAAYLAGGFGPATAMSAAKHAFVSMACDTCHDTGKSFYVGSGTALQLRPADHTAPNMAAPNDCSGCHETTDWNSTMLPAGHMPNPASQACGVCHTGLPNNYTTLATNAVLHTGIAGGCSQCHGVSTTLTFYNNFAVKSATLSPSHIPYSAGTECNACHSTTTYAVGSFSGMTMTAATHAFVSSTCDLCHETGASFYTGGGTPLQLRPADHTPPNMASPNDCSACHTTASWSSNVLPAGHMPNPGNQTCNACHTNAPTDYLPSTLAPNPILHTGIAGNCAQCHGSVSTTLSFYSSFPVKSAVLSPTHIPIIAGADCGSCHSPSTYAVGGFGPMNMTQATHAFVATTCDTCHEAGLSFTMGSASPVLQGRPADHTPANMAAPNDCGVCHTTANWISTVLPGGHMPNPANKACTVCHLSAPADYTPATLAANAVLHTGITSSTGCAQCHGSTSTTLSFYNNFAVKSGVLNPPHIPYSSGADCGACHTSTTYAAGGFGGTTMSAATHAFVPTTCDTCHEIGRNFYPSAAALNLQARPNSGTFNHLTSSDPNQATADCSMCHNTSSWSANVPPAGHMPNPANNACAACHTTPSATPGVPDYTQYSLAGVHSGSIIGSCAICHSGASWVGAPSPISPKASTGLVPPHIPVLAGADCGACHITSGIAIGGFANTAMSAAKHAYVAATCDTCHEAGLSFYPGAALNLQGRPADHSLGNMATPNDCSLCHTPANWNSTVLPTGHMPNPASQACTVCHTTAPADYTTATLAANAVLHTGITGGCSQCHGGATPLTWYNNFTPKDAVLAPAPHIPYLSGTDCSSCHSSSTYAAGGFGPMNMSQTTHAFVAKTCDTCHETNSSFYMGSASPALQLRPADHTTGQMVSPNDCSLCHTTANWNSTVMPAGHMPNPANQACTVCHATAPADYTPATLAANAVLHTGITGGCSQCHGGTTPLIWYNNFTPKDAVLAPSPHIPYLSGTDCSSCHSSSTYAAGGFGPMNMSQTTHAFVATTCDTCHEKGLSFYMGSASPALQLRPADHTAGQMVSPNDCSICHTTANWNSTAMPAGHMPNPANSACALCHTKAPADYTAATLAANTVLHTGITSGCIACHGAPNAAPPVFYPNYTPKDAVLSPVHIPTSTTPCEACHAISFTAFSGTTMSSAKHTAMFAVIGKTCDACHDLSTLQFYGVTNLTRRPNGHHVGTDCSSCHNTNNWDGGAAKKVAAAVATRSTVGTVVSASAAVAAQTGAAVTAAPRGARGLSHAGVTSNCASCHNGSLAAGKGAAHIASSAMCENCHTTIAWLPARFDHQGVTAKCSSCHNGVTATGKPTQHVQTFQDCQACHGTIAWQSATFSHLGLGAACQSCHNSITAAAKPIQHVSTTLDCGACHNTSSWTITVAPARLRPAVPSPRGAASGSSK